MRRSLIEGQQARYWELDFLKGLSILAIVILHIAQGYRFMPSLPPFFHRAVSPGGAGGHVFVFCSGFGLYLSHARNPLSYGAFLRRRFFKIYIPYILVVLLSFILSFFFRWIYDEPDKLQALCSHVFLYKMFSVRYEESFGTQMWFVSTIIQFYLISVPLFRAAEKLGVRRLLLLSCAASLAWSVFVVCAGLSEIRIWNSFFAQFLWEYVLGFACADYLLRGKQFRLDTGMLLLFTVLFLGLYALMGLRGSWLRNLNDAPAFLGFLAFCLLLRNLMGPPLLQAVSKIGSISYELFLLHILVFNLVFDAADALSDFWSRPLSAQLFLGLVAVLLSIAAAFLYHGLVTHFSRRRAKLPVR